MIGFAVVVCMVCYGIGIILWAGLFDLVFLGEGSGQGPQAAMASYSFVVYPTLASPLALFVTLIGTALWYRGALGARGADD